ncbi:hypothetical protein [Acetivibrio cellulolyticus]|uniref:hypothetical protein n=1 Tax=Acetivibrio cellulolyticus TaxID=35830 RepID=UPI0001E2E356|nr:hypothetical protein [Acetivibrio cellulolyticus]
MKISQLIFDAGKSDVVLHKNGNIYDFCRDNCSVCDAHTYKYRCLAEAIYYGVAKAKKAWAAKVYDTGIKQSYETYHSEWEATVAADYHAIIKYKDFALRNFLEVGI